MKMHVKPSAGSLAPGKTCQSWRLLVLIYADPKELSTELLLARVDHSWKVALFTRHPRALHSPLTLNILRAPYRREQNQVPLQAFGTPQRYRRENRKRDGHHTGAQGRVYWPRLSMRGARQRLLL